MSKILKNPTNKILKQQNKYAFFVPASNSYLQYVDNDVLSFTDVSGDVPFILEFDVIFNDLTTLAQYIISKRVSAWTEWFIRNGATSGTRSQLYLFLCNPTGTGTSAPINYIGKITSALLINTPYHIKIIYDGLKTSSGIKIYANNVDVTGADNAGGTYTGMNNTIADVYVGRIYSGSNDFGGYLKNIKLSKRDQVVFHLPMQDSSSVGLDVINSITPTTTNNVSVINYSNDVILKSQNLWSYYNGTSSVSTIGTTSTLGWMNNGVFNMQFDIIWPVATSSDYLMGTTTSAVGGAYGWIFYNYSANILRFYWRSNSVTRVTIATMLTISYNVPYRIRIRGDGVNFYYHIIRLDTNAVASTNEPTGVSCTYLPSVTMATALTIAKISSTSYVNCYIKNLKIFKDFAGTIPFMIVPMQDSTNIMKDVVGGLTGTPTDVTVVDI